MSVHYKFKSALDFDTITFDGLHINVSDLKKAIIHQKRLGKSIDFDLQITNAQTKEEYNEDTTLIPKNTSLIVARIPLAPNAAKKIHDMVEHTTSSIKSSHESEMKHVDLSTMAGTEEEKINAMMHQSTIDYNPTNYQKIRGGGQTGEVPPSYRCHRCHKPGHWIKNCPLGPVPREMLEIKRNTGIPRSFVERDKSQEPVNIKPVVPSEQKLEIPEDLVCSICKDLFTDAVMIPCCGTSFCDECVRNALLESEENECPDCHEKGTSPGSLIPNRFLRSSVNNFKNETGYIAPNKPPKVIKKIIEEEQEADKQSEEEEDTSHQAQTAADADNEQNKQTPEREDTPETTIQTTTDKRSPKDDDNNQYNGNYDETTSDSKESKEYSLVNATDSYQRQDHNPEQQHMVDPQIRRPHMPPYGIPTPSYPMGGVHPLYPQHNMGQPPHSYNHMGRPYNPQMQNYGRPPFAQQRPYNNSVNMPIRPRQPMPYTDIPSIYRGVAQQVGPGIIDDPLEAFNRIMREKERRKEEARRRSPFRGRRSRSFDRRRRRRSGSYNNSPIPRNNDRRLMDRDRKRRRSRSYSSSRSYSRSRSRTPPLHPGTPKRYSKSPPRRSRSISLGRRAPFRNKEYRRHDYREPINRNKREGSRPRSPLRYNSRDRNRPQHGSYKPRTPNKYMRNSQSRDMDRPYSTPMDQVHLSYDRHGPSKPDRNEISHRKYPEIKVTEKMDYAPPGTMEILPPGVEALDDESWLADDKYKPKVEHKTINPVVIEPSFSIESISKVKSDHTKTETTKSERISRDHKRSHDHASPGHKAVVKENRQDMFLEKVERNDRKHSKEKEKEKKAIKDKKRRKKEKEKENEVKKSKKHKRDKHEKENTSFKHSSKQKVEENNKNEEIEKSDLPALVPEPNLSINEVEPTDMSVDIQTEVEPEPEPIPSTPPLIKSDSILDLYENIDLDIYADPEENKQESYDFLALPEPSKWEIEESSGKILEKTSSCDEDKKESIPNEVLKRAENAIFTKALTGLRSSEPKSEYSSKEVSPLSSAVIRQKNIEKTSMSQNFQITIPTKIGHLERSVELKSDGSKSDKVISILSPVRVPVKERLGAKIKDISPSPKSTGNTSRKYDSEYKSSLKHIASAAVTRTEGHRKISENPKHPNERSDRYDGRRERERSDNRRPRTRTPIRRQQSFDRKEKNIHTDEKRTHIDERRTQADEKHSHIDGKRSRKTDQKERSSKTSQPVVESKSHSTATVKHSKSESVTKLHKTSKTRDSSTSSTSLTSSTESNVSTSKSKRKKEKKSKKKLSHRSSIDSSESNEKKKNKKKKSKSSKKKKKSKHKE